MIFLAPEPPLTIPDVPLTSFLLERAAALGEKPAFLDGRSGRVLTYRGWSDGVRQSAAGLAARGFRKGDVLAIHSANVPEYAVAFHAVSLLGGVVTTANPLFTVGELAGQIDDAGVRYLLTMPSVVEKAHEAARRSGVREVFVFGEADGAVPFASLRAAGGDPPEVAIDPGEDVVVLPYSSGTTGLPKGVMLTHRNLVANVLQTAAILDLDERDVMLGLLPFFHIYGMVVIMNLALHTGATVVTLPQFEIEEFLQVLERYRVTFAPIVPPIVLGLAKSPLVERYDLSALRLIYSGAAPLGEQVARAAGDRLGCAVLQGYGLTETSPVTHGTRPRAQVVKLGGIGPPVPNTEAKIVDVTTGTDLDANAQGEICIRGPQVMKGYLNRASATAAMIDAEGWLHTGDIGYADEDGCFFIVDRVKELIKYKGMQVAPAELEAVLLGHPLVADAAVVPAPDEEAGEVPRAFVVLKGDVALNDLLVYVAERVAPYKRIRAVEVIDQIPRAASGKILRRLLVDRPGGASRPTRAGA
jgi:acyl-CoA synthetase (AMP-forming)/AMP-acid ligase II